MSTSKQSKVLFPLGEIAVTANAVARLTPREIHDGLQRHAAGDWGDLSPSDACENARSLQHGYRILSVYGAGQNRFWIITEADRSVTTILLPLDY